MRASRRKAREKIKNVKTRAELDEWLEMLNLTEEERDIARLVYAKGHSMAQVCFATGYPRSQV